MSQNQAFALPLEHSAAVAGCLPSEILHGLASTERQIEAALSTLTSPFAHEVGGLLHRAGGKRVRPALLLASAALGDGGDTAAISAAAGIELLHLASLYHDDVIDQADLRRGNPSANARWGDRTATLAGTMVFALALGEFGRLDSVCNALASEAAARLREGQTLECERLFDLDVTEEQYFEVIAGKTAALFTLAARLGGYLGGVGPEGVSALQTFGQKLGLAFQIRDDICDMMDATSKTGKTAHADLAAGVYTLPTILCLADSGRAGQMLRALLSKGALNPGEIDVAVSQILASSAMAQCEAILVGLVAEACAALTVFPRGEARNWLLQMPRALVRWER